MEETPLEAIPTFAPQRRQTNKRSAYLILAIIIIILLFLGYRAVSSNKSFTPKPTPTPASSAVVITPIATATPTLTTSPTVTPTVTPKPTINPVDKNSGLDRSQLSVTVQNGSGTAGVAAKAVDILKNLGYNVVGSGNADNYNYTNVTIQVKSAKSDFLNLLKKDLGFSYTIGAATSDLPDSFSSDALVIIGQ
jgi:heme/copper-type cytochrome/quinol oxidase subunit 2